MDVSENVGFEVSNTQCNDLLVSSKIQKNGDNIFCILPSELHKLSNQIPSYKISSDNKESVPIYSFELYHTILTINIYQLTEKNN